MKNEKVVVLFSGGLDSTTTLYWAKKTFREVFALMVNYSQRHNIETQMAQKIAGLLQIKAHLIEFPLKDIAYSALIDKDKIIPDSLAASKNEAGIPFTYVPFRNGIFLSLAAAFAESRRIFDIVTGFNRIDTPDYPDTTETFTKKMEDAVNEGTSAAITGQRFTIHTPLIAKSKKEIIEWGLALGADYSYSISCYRGNEIPCLKCPSCDIRSSAFKQLNMEDPLIARLKKEGKA
ncbi:MAG: 7-cyano-7-deazaguanine synthase QueC [Acidobacteria bacterium]|jgi:7-cyano-7-deazaguanine synthase|nr:7-cyano-7-deazaguanine synthase QueC [Acidobacteriota bacterium]